MSELSSETNPQILVNDEQQEHQQDDAATTEARISLVSLDGECLDGECTEDNAATEKETQAKMQHLFQQVRSQIRSQGGTKAPKNSILELVQRVIDKEVEIAQVNSEQEHQQDDAATTEAQISSVSLDGECLDGECTEDNAATEKETQAKMQHLFQQVRSQIRSQGGTKAPKNSILELVQRVIDKEVEIAQVNSEQEHQQDDAATTEAQISSVSLDGECLDGECTEDNAATEKETQAKMQHLFQQVRSQIRSQGGTKAPKNSILELVQRVIDKEVEIAHVISEPEGKDVSNEEEKEVELLTEESKDEMALKKEELCAIFEEKLEACKKALRNEFEEQISQVRKEMQAYTDRALKDLQCKMQNRQFHSLLQTHPKEPQESKGQDKKQKPAAAPSLASRRGRLLTRTMTTIIPKTCAPVIIGPRAKSETLTSSKGESCRFLPRDPALYLPVNKAYQSRKPLPPACPPLHQCKKSVRAKPKTGN